MSPRGPALVGARLSGPPLLPPRVVPSLLLRCFVFFCLVVLVLVVVGALGFVLFTPPSTAAAAAVFFVSLFGALDSAAVAAGVPGGRDVLVVLAAP